MSFAGELAGFARGINAGSTLGSRMIQGRIDKEKLRRMKPATDADIEGQPNPYGGSTPQVTTASPDGTKTSSTSPASGEIAWKGATPEQRALLLTIASKESPGYNVIYGGSTFDDYSRHPGRDIVITSGPNKGKTSSAAGKYQFLGSTWADQAQKWGLKDFSPENQDIAALHLAEENYGRITGRSLNEDLKSKDPAVLAGIGQALKGTWTSLPGGIEQGQDTDQFVSSFNSFLGQPYTPGDANTSVAAKPATSGVLPDEEEAGSTATDTTDPASPDYVDPGKIDVAVVEDPNIQTPQVAAAFEEDPYAMHAASGGVIPEFDDGGKVDPAFTSLAELGSAAASANADNSGVLNVNDGQTPNVGSSFGGVDNGNGAFNVFHSGGSGNTGGQGLSQGQNIFTMPQLNDPTPPEPNPNPEFIQDTGEVLQTAPAPEAPAPAPTTPAPTDTTTPSQDKFADLNKKPAVVPPKETIKWNNRINNADIRRLYDVYRERNTYTAPARDHYNGWQDRSPMSYGDWFAKNYGNYARIPGSTDWGVKKVIKAETGGMIPEYAEGGKVLSFDELLAQEKGDRDRAAKRFNAQKGGPVSSAYDPDGFWEKAPAKSKSGGGPKLPKNAPTPTPRPSPEDKTASTPKANPNASYPYGGETSVNPLQAAVDAAGPKKPKAVAAGTPTAGYDPPVIPEPDPMPVQAGDAMDPGATGVPLDPHSPPEVAPVPRSQPLPRPDPLAAEPPRYPPNVARKAAPAQPEVTAPVLAPSEDPLAQITRPPPQVDPERFAPEEEPVPGVWLHGQFIPADTKAVPGMGFAEGGVVPEEDEDEPVMQSQHQPNYLTSPSAEASGNAQDAAPRETASLRPTEKMITTLAGAVSNGIDYINNVFSNGGGGAIPDGGREGAMRMARGEGSATPQEIEEIDDVIDPDRQMSEADRHMTRLAKTVSWYLEQGRPEDAAAASASLLMYGAGRAQKLGTLAAAAYQDGDVQKAAKFIEKAYETIPDASSLEVQVAADGQGFVMNKIGADGESEQIAITPEQMPGVIRGMQDNSLYWQQIERLADPAGYRQKQTDIRQEKQNVIERQQKLADEKTQREQKLADTAAANAESDRRRKRDEEYILARPGKDGGALSADERTAVPKEKLRPLQVEYAQVKDPPEGYDEGDPEYTEWKQKRDRVLSRISDLIPNPKDEAEWFKKNFGIEGGEWDYIPADETASGDAAPAVTETPTSGGEFDDPSKYKNARQNKHGVWLYTDESGQTQRIPRKADGAAAQPAG